MSLAEHVLRQWAEHPERGTPFVARHERPGSPAVRAPVPVWLPASVQAGLAAQGVSSLYSHQAQALEHVRAGRDVVVATPTASGKSLVYHLAVLAACAEDAGARALYLFPTKALAHDQVVSLDALATACGVDARPHAFDGDTPADARRVIRRAARVVVSNPDMLHAGVLPHHDRWAAFFAGLRYVVLDEVHTYRGVFGSHVANVLRRLKRVCRFHGSNPQFILSSATVANPAEHAASLLAGPVAAVTESGAPRGKATFYVYNPPLVDGAKGIRGSYIQAARRLTRALAKVEVPTIVFANSRLNVERLTRHLQEDVASEGIDPTTVSGYRGGYLPDHRRAVEAGLRAGHIRTVVSTSALELGVDVGQLEACVLAGYPGTIASLWQRAGRAGRRDSPAVIILVARSEAVDQYLAAHPDALFGQTPEHALLDPDHLLIVADHLKCAAFELPFKAGEAFGTFGADRTAEVLGWLAGRRLLLEGAERWQWTGEPYPAQGVGLRAIAEGNFTVLDKAHKHRVVGEVDYHAAASTLYPQAIYIVGGETYQVLDLDWTGRRATVEPVAVDYYTDAVTFEGLARLSVFDERQLAGEGAGVGHGEVRVFERVVGFKKIRFATGENVGYGDVQLPETELHTTGLWLEAPEDLGLRLGLVLHQTIDALEGLLRAIRHVAAVRLMCAPQDLGTAAVGEGPAEGLPTLYVYERYPGGVGLHEALFEQAEAVLADADALLGGCGCTDGCPACVGAAAMGEVRSRRRVRDVLRVLRGERGAARGGHLDELRLGVTDDSPLQRALARREAMLRGQRAPGAPAAEEPAAEEPAAAPSSSLEARVALLRSARAGWPTAPAVEAAPAVPEQAPAPPRRRGPTRADLQRIREDRAAPPAAPAITAQVIADRLAALAAAPVAPAPRVARPDAPRTVTGRLDALAASLGEVAPPARQARQAIPGVERGTPRGRCFVQVSTRDPETRYGDRELGTLLGRDAGLASLLAGDAAFADFDPRGALFLDLETTGLAIGQGTLPFMIGAAWFRGEDLVLEQWLLRDADEEPAALEDLADRLADLDWLVTYNGRTFDLPLLAARYALHGMALPPLAGHLDLLPISRRLLKHGLPDCRLATVERRLLGVNRVDDLPGRLLPAAWLAWQHGEDAGPLLGGLRHNRDDVLSMVTLLDLLLERAATADSLVLRDPPAALALAAAALKVGRHAEAEAIFTAAAGFPETAAAGARGLGRLARARKKAEKKSGG